MTGLEIGLAVALYVVVALFLALLFSMGGENPAMYLYAVLWPVAFPIVVAAACAMWVWDNAVEALRW